MDMLLAVLFAVFAVQFRVALSTNKTLHVLHMSWGNRYLGDFGAMADYAFDLAHSRDDILPSYNIQTHTVYTENKDIGLAVKGFIQQVTEPPYKIAILGPFFSSQTKVTAATAKYYNLLQVSYTTTSPFLSDQNLYPYFARIVESMALHNPAILKILNLYNWKRVATITQTHDFVMEAHADMQKKLSSSNISILASTTYPEDPTPQIKQIKDSKAKIILTYSNRNEGNRIFCMVYKEKMYGPRYQWIHWSEAFGISPQLEDSDIWTDGCTLQQVLEAAEGVITFEPVKVSEFEKNNKISQSTLSTTTEIEEGYPLYLSTSSKHQNVRNKIFVHDVFDSAWSLALALNASVAKLAGLGEDLVDFDYTKKHLADVLYKSLLEQRFDGLTGDVSFDANGDRISAIVIKQVRDGQFIPVAEYSPITDMLSMYEGQDIQFQGSKPPSDWDVTVYTEVVADYRLVYLTIALAGVGLIYCISTVMVSRRFKHLKLIKLSSPRINLLIVLGCALTYIAVPVFGIDSLGVERKPWICYARLWLLVLGFTMAFGSMFSKTWRVHVLFTNQNLQRKVVKDSHLFSFVLSCWVFRIVVRIYWIFNMVKDSHLFSFVLIALSVDVLVLIIWHIVDPFEWSATYLPEQTDAAEPGKIIQPLIYTCSSKYSKYWSGVLYSFKGLLLIFGIFFAWETRKVKIEALNDSKHIGISVYNIMIMSVISVPLVNFLSPDQTSIIYGVISISILVCASMTITLVYGSKIYMIYVHGNKVDEMAAQLPFQSTLKPNQQSGNSSKKSTHDLNRLQPSPLPSYKPREATTSSHSSLPQ